MKDEWWLSLFDPLDNTADSMFGNVTNCQASLDWGNGECGAKDSNDDDSTCCGLNGQFSSRGVEIPSRASPSSTCYKNVDLMREKLQIGTAKVISRSWSATDLCTGGSSVDPVRDGALAMVHEISSKVDISKNFLSYDKIFNSLKVSDKGSLVKKQRRGSRHWDSAVRHRSCSTPNMLGHETQSSLELENNRARIQTMKRDSFEKHFGSVLTQIREVFSLSSPLPKMQCLTSALRTMAYRAMDLRRMNYFGPGDPDWASHAVSAEDLLPLLVLMLLKLEPAEVGKLYVEMCYISEMMADFLSSGCHSYALTEFQMALRVLSQTCDELSLF